MADLDDKRVRLLLERAVVHQESGEDHVRVEPLELAALVKEILRRRAHRCPTRDDYARQDNRVWGYDG